MTQASESEQPRDESIESCDEPATLDPPGTIAVVGAGPLGIEAALYGRYLGYDVTLIESDEIGYSMANLRDRPLPMLPDRCLSRLALQAIQTQRPDKEPMTLPITIGQWIDEFLVPLCETDLLRGRVRCPFRVKQIDAVEVAPDDAANVGEETIAKQEAGAEVPPHDFRLLLAGIDGQTAQLDAEAVVLAVGRETDITCAFDLPAEYFFRIGQQRTGDAEQDFHSGLIQIVEIYSGLAGRSSLDLYRPRRS